MSVTFDTASLIVGGCRLESLEAPEAPEDPEDPEDPETPDVPDNLDSPGTSVRGESNNL